MKEKSSLRVGDGSWVVQSSSPEICAGVWAEEIPEKLLISEPELCWEGPFHSQISEETFAESHLCGCV